MRGFQCRCDGPGRTEDGADGSRPLPPDGGRLTAGTAARTAGGTNLDPPPVSGRAYLCSWRACVKVDKTLEAPDFPERFEDSDDGSLYLAVEVVLP